jgi:hypothetical protein
LKEKTRIAALHASIYCNQLLCEEGICPEISFVQKYVRSKHFMIENVLLDSSPRLCSKPPAQDCAEMSTYEAGSRLRINEIWASCKHNAISVKCAASESSKLKAARR